MQPTGACQIDGKPAAGKSNGDILPVHRPPGTGQRMRGLGPTPWASFEGW
jgi:hypothetical protein